jgi:hypothetical protein
VPASIDQQQYKTYTTSNGELNGNLQTAGYDSSEAPSLSSLGLIEDMLNTPGQMDWVSSPCIYFQAFPYAL